MVAITSYAMLAFIIFGMSCTVTIDGIKETLRRKKPFALALACQVIFMPALAFACANLMQLNDLQSICLILLGSCPGGSFSNVLTYFARGNQALSIGLTFITNSTSILSLPLLLFIFGSSYPSTVIPYRDILVSLSLVLIPAILGVLFRHKSEKYAKYGEIFGASIGALMVVGAVISGIVSNGDALTNRDLLPWKVIASVTCVGPLGMLTSFLLCMFLPLGPKLSIKDTITISLETGIQNTILALAIVNISFTNTLPAFELFQAQLIPVMWGLIVLVEGTLLATLFRYVLSKNDAVESTEKDADDDVELPVSSENVDDA
jgi:BASS family bile acid:Na+ symporter